MLQGLLLGFFYGILGCCGGFSLGCRGGLFLGFLVCRGGLLLGFLVCRGGLFLGFPLCRFSSHYSRNALFKASKVCTGSGESADRKVRNQAQLSKHRRQLGRDYIHQIVCLPAKYIICEASE